MVRDDGRVLARRRRATPATEGSEAVLAAMREMATEPFAEAKAPLEIAGLGLGIPGPIDTDRGLCLATQATAQAKPSSSLATAVTATERRLPRRHKTAQLAV